MHYNKPFAVISLFLLLAIASCGGGGADPSNQISPSVGSSCSGEITGYYFVTTNSCAYGTLYDSYFFIEKNGSSISAYMSPYGTFTGTIDDNCNLSLSTRVTSSGETYTYGCTGTLANTELNLTCDYVDRSTGDVTGKCAYNSSRLVGSGCSDGIPEGIYNATSPSCNPIPIYVRQEGSSIWLGSMSGYINSECVISLSGGNFGAYSDEAFVLFTSDGCFYSLDSVVGSSCSDGIAQGYYNIEASGQQAGSVESPCISVGTEITQNSNDISIGDFEGYIDSKCAIALPNESCVGAYNDGTITMTCPSCTLNISPITTSRYQLGLYELGQDPWASCETYSFGDPARLFFSDAYVDLNGTLLSLTDSSKFEVDDAGGNNLLSTDFNSDYTMQFAYKDQTATASLTDELREFDVKYASPICSFVFHYRLIP